MRAIKKNSRGFTLVELMIVVAVIGILAVVAIPNFVYYRNKTLVASAVASCESMRTAMAAYACSSDSNLFPVGLWADGPAGWDDLCRFMIPLGTTLRSNMKEQGYTDFIYRTITVAGDEGSDYFFVFQAAGAPADLTGALIEVRNGGIDRWTGSL